RLGLILAGAFGSYSLGANNIANVMGVFVPSSPFNDISVAGLFTMTSAQQLFLIGAIAIAVGVFTYSKRVMLTVGNELLPLSPIAAWVAVVSHSIVLFLFASQGLKHLLESSGLPSIPLVPVSSSQAVVGAVLGIALVQGGRGFRWRVFGSISLGWVITPVIACAICFVGLFFLQNVFNQNTYREVPYLVSQQVIDKLAKEGVAPSALGAVKGERYENAMALDEALKDIGHYGEADHKRIMRFARRDPVVIDRAHFTELNRGPLSSERLEVVHAINGQYYPYEWMLREDLAKRSKAWRQSSDKEYNRQLERDLQFVIRLFRAE
ncbi:MAG TPA: inorganic phosphate transporter, partial [Rhodospirillaceae bacterium]|nr:inorganic phosphate transporter [Rhodospirillaceae bacterium]